MNIEVNNIQLFYEKVGRGKSIILLHGNSSSHKIFDVLINKLKEDYTVYAIDSRCQGNSEKAKDISYDLMANDVIEFIKKLNIEKPIIYGLSDGGIIGLLVAIKEPLLLSKLAISGANITPDCLYKKEEILEKVIYFFTRKKLLGMMLKEPNISEIELQSIQIPTLVLAGEKDIIRYDHTKKIADNIKNSILKIIPNENHSSYVVHNDKIYNIIIDFIK